jgi:hypothetical protein
MFLLTPIITVCVEKEAKFGVVSRRLDIQTCLHLLFFGVKALYGIEM